MDKYSPIPLQDLKGKWRWTCSDFTNHEHYFKYMAWLCGRIQFYAKRREKAEMTPLSDKKLDRSQKDVMHA